MELQHVLYEVDDEGAALITINRPDKLNALNAGVLGELDACLRRARSDRKVRGVIITGSGEKSFSAGADLAEFQNLNALSGHRFALRGQTVFNHVEEMPRPVIAAVNGFALGGGCELALACHIRVAADHAVFGQPEVGLGLLAGFGGTQRLPRIVGRGIAAEMLLLGDRIDAERALQIGLVSQVVPRESVVDAAREMVHTIATRAPIAVSMTLDALRASDSPLQQGLRFEAALFGQLCDTEDFREGVKARTERREPEFKGK